jgi:outer membrane protein TolC
MKRYITTLIILLIFPTFSQAQSLEDYFQVAAENNPQLQALYNEYEAALQRVPQVNALPDPEFSFGYFISPVETRLGPQQAKFSLSQMFPWFGTLEARGDAASLQAESKFQSFINQRNRLYFQVASAYYPLYELQELIEIEKENIRILESYKTIATRKFENGSGTMVDVLRADIRLEDANTRLSILQKQRKPLETSFNKLLNRSKTEEINITDSLTITPLPEANHKDTMITNHPQIKALDLKMQASEANELAARKQGMPKLGLGVDYVVTGKRTDINLPDNGRDVLMPMLSISIPVFRGKYKASVEEARFMQESFNQRKKAVENQLIAEYESVLFKIQKQKELINLYQQQTKTLKQSLNLLFTAYGNSGENFEEVLRMQQELLKYRKMKAQALVEHEISVAKVNYLTSKSYSHESNQ